MSSNSNTVSAGAPSMRFMFGVLGAFTGFLKFVRGLMARALSFFIDQGNFIRFRYFDFVPRPDDVFIVSYPRSGTTWTQMILYQLSTNGNMDFDHIAQVVPWFERACLRGRSLEGRPSRRVMMSHLRYRWIPKGPCKYVYVARNGKDVAVSYYHFHRTHIGFKGTFPQFFDRFVRGKVLYGSWFKHVADWWSHREDPNVLFLTYEELSRDLEGCMRRLIDFCGFDVSPERLPEIVERCSFAFMKKHEDKFDPMREILMENGFEPSSFIRKGKSGNWNDYMVEGQEARFEQAFQKHLGNTGLDFTPAPKTPRPAQEGAVQEANA